MRCAKSLAGEAHEPHWHVVEAAGLVVAQGDCSGEAHPREPETVTVGLDDLRRLVARGSGHAHDVPGVWDWDNGDAAGKPCSWCPAYARLLAAVGGREAIPPTPTWHKP